MSQITADLGREHQQHGHAIRKRQFSLASLLVLLAAVVAIAGFVLEHQRRSATQAALSRYESDQISTVVPDGKFRVITKTMVDSDHVKVIAYRIECGHAFYAELMGRDGDSSGLSSKYNADAGIHFSEWTYVFDHLPTENKLKVSNMGYSLSTVPPTFRRWCESIFDFSAV